jgi:hypothetical protein
MAIYAQKKILISFYYFCGAVRRFAIVVVIEEMVQSSLSSHIDRNEHQRPIDESGWETTLRCRPSIFLIIINNSPPALITVSSLLYLHPLSI